MCQTIPISMATSHVHLQSRHYGMVSPGSLSFNFQAFRIVQSQTISPLSRLHLTICLQDMWSNKMTFFSLMLACHIGAVTVRPNPPTGFKYCRNYGLMVWLGLPLCCLLAVVVLTSLIPRIHGWSYGPFSYVYLHRLYVFLCFQFPCHLFHDSSL